MSLQLTRVGNGCKNIKLIILVCETVLLGIKLVQYNINFVLSDKTVLGATVSAN